MSQIVNQMKPRIEYLDAIKGVAILFIVYGHIPMYSYGEGWTELASFRPMTSLVQLTMFFFVSGFLFNSEKMLIGGAKSYWLKFRQLVIPAFVFCSLFISIHDIDVFQCLTDKYKAGYWFTLTLFEYIVVQSLFDALVKRFHVRTDGIGYVLLLAGLAFIMYSLSVPMIEKRFGSVSGVVGFSQFRYFLYFALGRLVSLHKDRILTNASVNRLANIVIPIFLLLAVCNFIYGISLDGIFFYLNMLGFEVFAFLAFFILIYKNRDFFSSENIIARSITFIGRRTLEIYLLHYLFISQDLTPLGRFFIEHPSPLLELLCSGIMTLVIVSVCLLVGELIRKSSLCSRWLING